ncbi:hypothetical protein PR048_024047, partial [Dryococelus australis]
MGYNKLPNWRHYWSTSPDLSVPAVSQTMSRNRFDMILSFLHASKNTAIQVDNNDKPYKGYINKKSSSLRVVQRHRLEERAVLHLCQEELNKAKWCLSTITTLRKQLHVEGTMEYGTIRQNRKGLPSLTDDKRLNRIELGCSFSNFGVGYFVWKDRKSVHLASNYHGAEGSGVRRRLKDGTGPKIITACCILCEKALEKRRYRIFWVLLNIAFVNSYKPSLLQFRRTVAAGIMTYKLPSSGGKLGDKQVSPGKKRKLPSPQGSSERRKVGPSVPKMCDTEIKEFTGRHFQVSEDVVKFAAPRTFNRGHAVCARTAMVSSVATKRRTVSWKSVKTITICE